MVTQKFELARSTFYAARGRRNEPILARGKRGPRTKYSDAELLEEIRGILARSPFLGEGRRKVWARLLAAGVHSSKPRVLRLMREANLLAPVCRTRVLGSPSHEGTITTERPDQVWGAGGSTALGAELRHRRGAAAGVA